MNTPQRQENRDAKCDINVIEFLNNQDEKAKKNQIVSTQCHTRDPKPHLFAQTFFSFQQTFLFCSSFCPLSLITHWKLYVLLCITVYYPSLCPLALITHGTLYTLLCITVYYCVLLCITVYYCVLLCITVYYCVLLCIIVYYCVLLCIIVYNCVLLCIIVYYCV